MGTDKRNVKKTAASGTDVKRKTPAKSRTPEKNKTATGKNQNRKRNLSENAEAARNSAAKKAQREKEVRELRTGLILSVIVGVLLVILISVIMQSRYLKVKQLKSEYSLGEQFQLKDFVKAVNGKAVVELADADYVPEKTGSCEVEFVVKCGKLKKTKTITIKAVDENAPVIQGPSTLGIIKDEEISLLDYYTVEDEEPDLTDSLTISQELDTGTVGSTDYTLYVTDWGDNSSSMQVELVVCAFDGDKKTAALAVREFNRETGNGVSAGEVYVYQPENMEYTYVLIEDALYKVKDNAASVADENESLSAQVQANGTKIFVDDLEYFNYNK